MLKLNASSVALGAALAVGAMLVMGQAGPQPQYVSWGPPKAGVVNIYNAPGGAIPPGGTLVLFQVPSDRWLTVTRVSATQTSGGSPTRYAEDYQGTVTERGDVTNSPPGTLGGLSSDSPVGWVFRPGSQFVIKNLSATPATILPFTMIGYQTRD